MKILIIALSDGAHGLPITATRSYAEIPICNRPVYQHILEKLPKGEVTFLTKGKIDGKIAEEAEYKELLEEADLLIPGDILPLESITSTGILSTASSSQEQETLQQLLKQHDIEKSSNQIAALRVNYPWEILTANQHLCDQLTAQENPGVTIEENVTIKGAVVIGKGTIIKAGSYIEGPVIIGENCEIGPHAHLRPHTSIANQCKIGKSEVVDAVIMEGSVSKHHAYLGHSVLGADVNVGALSVTADYRHDGKNHTTLVGDKKIDTGRRKVGAFIGDHARIAIQTSFYPGRKLWPHGTTLPGEILTKDRVA